MSASPLTVFARLVEQLAELLQPLFHASATAAAIVLFTLLVRLLVHPLSRAAARGQRARAALRPRIAELRRRYAKDPGRLQQSVRDLHAEERVSPLSGLLPGLLQLPAFFVLYRIFSGAADGGGRGGGLLAHRLFAAPLGGRWSDALADGGLFGPAGLVYVGLFAVTGVVAVFGYRRARASAAVDGPGAEAGGGEPPVPGLRALSGVTPFLPFFTLVTVAVVPLAAALYVVTSAAWTAVERAVLYRG
ncbi:membrane protein insertase YidC [Streptomyces sp. MS06]|uniref:membrane protein insertase YidC n=1 Tax=Streptomyces sp. MS06 TaxID=3385974 RepID=UPI00399F12E3